jgi:hypothetical protein
MLLYYSDISLSQLSNPIKDYSYISIMYIMTVGKGGMLA